MEMLFAISSTIVATLLGIIAYFLKEINSEFKAVKKDLNQAIIRLTVAEEKSRNGYTELRNMHNSLEKRVEKIEGKV